MLEPNRLNPPQPYRVPQLATASAAQVRAAGVFISADDFDSTGILAGCDPCASNYWWMPELHTAAPAELAVMAVADTGVASQATRRTSARPQAAA